MRNCSPTMGFMQPSCAEAEFASNREPSPRFERFIVRLADERCFYFM